MAYGQAHLQALRNVLLSGSHWDKKTKSNIPDVIREALSEAAWRATPGSSPEKMLQGFQETIKKQEQENTPLCAPEEMTVLGVPNTTSYKVFCMIESMEEAFKKEVEKIKF